MMTQTYLLSFTTKIVYSMAKSAPAMPSAKLVMNPALRLMIPLSAIPEKNPMGKRPSRKARRRVRSAGDETSEI